MGGAPHASSEEPDEAERKCKRLACAVQACYERLRPARGTQRLDTSLCERDHAGYRACLAEHRGQSQQHQQPPPPT